MNKDFKKILDRSSGFQVKGKKSKEGAWNEINSRIHRKKLPAKVILWASAAAVISFVLIFFTPDNKVVKTALAEQREVFLPDGSKVILNADSQIKFSEKNWDNKREIKLKGEAFFEIKKGNTMRIKCEPGNVRILGTSFNVYSRDRTFVVDCFSGSVEVSNASEKLILIPHTGVRLDKKVKHFQRYEHTTNGFGSWRKGNSYFEKKPLDFVFEEFERQYGYTVNLESDISSRQYTGFFTHKNIDQALETICLAMGVSYTINTKQKEVWIKKSISQNTN